MFDRMPGQRFLNQQTPTTEDGTSAQWAASAGAPQPIAVQRYRSNAPVLGLIAGVVVVALAAALVWYGTRPPSASAPGAPSSSQPSVGPTGPTPSPGWQGIEFKPVGSSVSGYWQVSEATWNGDQATIDTTITVDQGTLRFTFFVLRNNTNGQSDFYQPTGGTLMVGEVPQGKSQTGTLIFELPRGDFTLYLATSKGVQITALLIKG